jgi:hypothetical protein
MFFPEREDLGLVGGEIEFGAYGFEEFVPGRRAAIHARASSMFRAMMYA